MKKVLGIVLGVLFLALLVGTFGFLYKKSQRKPVIYRTATPIRADIILKTVATGAVVPREEVAVKPLVPGIVEELHVEEGQIVERGAPVARIRVIPDVARLSDADSRVRRAEITLADRERDLARQSALFAEGTVPRAELDRAEVAVAEAREDLLAAKSTLDIVRTGTSERVARTETTLVRATISGMVLEVPVKVGNSVIQANNFNEGTTIALVANMGDMIFEGKVDESEVGKIRAGMELLLTVGALPDEQISARLEHIAPKGQEESGAIQFALRAAVEPRADLFLRANYSANADIVLDKREQALAIDEGLLQFDRGRPFVEVEVGEQEFERRDVEVGLSDGLVIEVLSGLAEGERIKNPNTDLAADFLGPGASGGGSRGGAVAGQRPRRAR
jgi:HlyD family secretion protein